MRIDAHQHFWRYTAAEYDWIDSSMLALRRDFLPADLAPELTAGRLDGTVAVQARQMLAETDWLLELAAASPAIKGVVGWVPLAAEGAAIAPLLDRYASNARFKGVRHVLQGEPDAYFDHPGFNAALHEVARRDLAYDLLVFARQLPAALMFAARHPSLRIVVDHIAKPVVDGIPSPLWREQIRALAQHSNIFCKFSGLVTEAPDRRWTLDSVRPYFDVVLEAFGPARLMWGSDWPVCLVASTHARWLTCVETLVQPLSPDERAAILGGTATQFYRITD